MSDGKFLGVTHFTQVDVQPGGINIQHVEHLHQADILNALGIELEMKQKGKVMLPSNSAIMYNELVRLGMPTGDGYSEKHFSNSYTK